MLWLRTPDTETDRTKPRQTCILFVYTCILYTEPESSPELQKLQKNNFSIFRQIYAADRSIKTAQTREIRAIRQVIPYINNSCANKTLSVKNSSDLGITKLQSTRANILSSYRNADKTWRSFFSRRRTWSCAADFQSRCLPTEQP